MFSEYETTSSMRESLWRDKPEYKALNGVVVKKGTEFGLPAPRNFALYALLSQLNPEP